MMKFERIQKSAALIEFEKNNPVPPFDAIEQVLKDSERRYLKMLADNGLYIEDYEPHIYWKDDMTIIIEAVPILKHL